jgi:hypothetical protein
MNATTRQLWTLKLLGFPASQSISYDQAEILIDEYLWKISFNLVESLPAQNYFQENSNFGSKKENDNHTLGVT